MSIQRHLQDYEAPDHQWGFINSWDEISIEARFDDVRPFSEGLAAVNENGLWGYINMSGDWVIEPEFIKAHNFHKGVARIRGSNGLMGLISQQGDTIIAPVYNEIYKQSNGYIITEANHKKGMVRLNGSIIFDNKFDDIKIIGSNLFGMKTKKYYSLVDNNKDVLVQGIHTIKKAGILKTDSGWGVVDSLGNWMIQPSKLFIAPGHQHHFVTKDMTGWGVYDTRTYFTKYIATSRIKYLGEARYALKSDEGWQITDGFLQSLNHIFYESIYDFSEGMAPVDLSGYWGYIDASGKMLIEPVFMLPWQSKEGKIRFFTRTGFGFHDHHGNVLIEPRYEDVRDFSEGMAAYLKN